MVTRRSFLASLGASLAVPSIVASTAFLNPLFGMSRNLHNCRARTIRPLCLVGRKQADGSPSDHRSTSQAGWPRGIGHSARSGCGGFRVPTIPFMMARVR